MAVALGAEAMKCPVARNPTWLDGHLGTILYQKASDVFGVTKVSSLFVICHTVSRHSNAPDFYFVISNGVPAMPSEEQTPLVQGIINGTGKVSKAKKVKEKLDEEDVNEIFGESESLTPGELIAKIRDKFSCAYCTAYKIVNNSIDDEIITKEEKTYVASV